MYIIKEKKRRIHAKSSPSFLPSLPLKLHPLLVSLHSLPPLLLT